MMNYDLQMPLIKSRNKTASSFEMLLFRLKLLVGNPVVLLLFMLIGTFILNCVLEALKVL